MILGGISISWGFKFWTLTCNNVISYFFHKCSSRVGWAYLGEAKYKFYNTSETHELQRESNSIEGLLHTGNHVLLHEMFAKRDVG